MARHHDQGVRRCALIVVMVLMSHLVALGLALPTSATERPFSAVFSANVHGDVTIAANTLMTCDPASPGCAAAQYADTSGASTPASNNNNNYAKTYVDIDGDPSTLNSSTATLTIPDGGTVLYALLVWGSATTPTNIANGNASHARLTTPSGQHHAVTASLVDSTGTTPAYYQSSLDVTDIVVEGGTGEYTMGGVTAKLNEENGFAGWALVVAVSDPDAPMRNLTVFSGFESVYQTAVDFTVDGLLTPLAGSVDTTIGVVAYEGDANGGNDQFALEGYPVSDSLNNAANVFNSTISARGSQIGGRNPAFTNQLGFDADMFSGDGMLPNGATTAQMRLSSSSEKFFPGVVTFATELYEPNLVAIQTATDLNGGGVELGDVLRYTTTVENQGFDIATDVTFRDAIPQGTQYVAHSLQVDDLAVSDNAGDDVGETSGGDQVIQVRLGIGATASAGGVIGISAGLAQHEVTFDVVVSPDAGGQTLVATASLSYRGATTGTTASSPSTTVMTVVSGTAMGNAPIAVDDSVTILPTSSTIVSIDVLGNDSDLDGDPLNVVAIGSPAGGTTVVVGDAVQYSPRTTFTGTDVFTYTICDPAGNRSTATVRIVVLNTAPVAVDDVGTVASGADAPVSVLANDADANGDGLSIRTVQAVSDEGGTVTVEGTYVVYRSPPTFVGTDTFTYVVTDARGWSDTGHVTVHVQSPPVAIADEFLTQTGQEIAVNVGANDTDPYEGTLTWAVESAPVHGTIGLGSGGTGSYIPAEDYYGTDTWTYRVSNGTLSAVGTVSVIVNGAPIAGIDVFDVPGGRASAVAVLANDIDPEGATLTVASLGAPSHGTAEVSADQTVIYTPQDGWLGPDTATYTVTDSMGGTSDATVTFQVGNQVPVTVQDSAVTAYLTPVVVDVAANDTDANPGQALTLTAASADHATVDIGQDGRLTVNPVVGYSGAIQVTYTVRDDAGGSAQGVLLVQVGNAPPTAVDDAATTRVGRSILVDLLVNDSDPNQHDRLVITALEVPVDRLGAACGAITVEGNRVRFSPAASFSGEARFGYTISDGTDEMAGTAVITVINAPPTARNDVARTRYLTSITIAVLDNDTDPDGGFLTVVGVSAPVDRSGTVRGGVEVVGQAVIFRPAVGWSGSAMFSYTIRDAFGAVSAARVDVVVGTAPPSALNGIQVQAGGSVILPVVGDSQFTVVSVVQPIQGGEVRIEGGSLVFIAAPDYVGAVSVEYVLRDEFGDLVTATLIVQVLAAPAPSTSFPEHSGVSEPSTSDDAVATPVGADMTTRWGLLIALLALVGIAALWWVRRTARLPRAG